MTDVSPIERAIKAAGSQKKLAEQLGVGQTAVSNWVTRKHRRIPAERVLPIEALTGVSRHELRPDLYPRES